MQIVADVLIDAPPEVAFATVIDIAHWPDFIPDITRVEMLTDGPVAVGTRFRETRQMHGRGATEEMTVATLAPPHRLVLTAESHGARYVSEHEVVALESGSRLTLKFSGTPVTWTARLLSVLAVVFSGSVQKMLRRDLKHVAAEAARRASAAVAGARRISALDDG